MLTVRVGEKMGVVSQMFSMEDLVAFDYLDISRNFKQKRIVFITVKLLVRLLYYLLLEHLINMQN